MIYSTVFSNTFVSSLATNLKSDLNIYSPDVASFAIIYSGAQPTPANFIANWSTDYYIASNTDPNTSASNVLVSYGGIGYSPADITTTANIAGVTADVLLGVNLNSIYLASPGTGIYWNNGTATWAAIFPNQSPPSNGITGLLQSSISSATNFILCPVSATGGNGIVQLSTTTISGSAPTLDSIDIIITI